ncbi:hypothetical protein HH214_14525 [Mucilaginibacter robiniae]|uniref:Arabinogalactan endo-beta-1,4-galactanase n=1 Tax=Mucilaginibacter robiniae TaxID=2728022 RepID=A0A7L5E362_9SPHI|nr:glycosyl hydrolase 53 family protein [Mucilaginibacter robiniae]QJD96998.1 hypothetical protein HH214_14525 [Mucilaginibacter robiniae]
MRRAFFTLLIAIGCQLGTALAQIADSDKSQPSEIVVTPYKTTMIADGRDVAQIKITVIDKQGQEVTQSNKVVHFVITGDAKVIGTRHGNEAPQVAANITEVGLQNGEVWLTLQAGKNRNIVKFEAKSNGLITGSTEIHTIQPGTPHPVTTAAPIAGTAKITNKILGADISFLPQLESRGMKFYDTNGQQSDVLSILKSKGFNYIRLRIFDHPDAVKGYSSGKGFCDLPHTLAMAKRIKAAGLHFLLDFHYSDTWADPQRQDKPAAWAQLNFATLQDSVQTYTRHVMQALKNQGTEPDMVQVGNEINHGMLWPDGAVNNLDSLSKLVYAGIKGVKAVSPSAIIMLHVALGGQDEESRFFVDNMLKRRVPFDVIGLSYYPKWHGTPDDLSHTMTDLTQCYNKYVMVAEYSQRKQEVNDIAFTAPGNKALGTFIWEPLNTWEAFFDKDGKANAYLNVYPAIARKYHVQ